MPYGEMIDCHCAGAELVSDLRDSQVVLARYEGGIYVHGPVAKVASRRCPDCGGTGLLPDDREFRRAESLLNSHGYEVVPFP